MNKVRVSCISFVNSIPFVEGLLNSDLMSEMSLFLDTPDQCAAKMKNGKADIGQVPVAILPSLHDCEIVTDFCISSPGPARTVILISNCPIENIKKINLDPHSRTSVRLARILAHHYWNISCQWETMDASFQTSSMGPNDAAVLIGDKVFEVEDCFPVQFDLATEWKNFTGLSFVFAVWAATKNLDKTFLYRFNKALGHGVDQTHNIIAQRSQQHAHIKNMESYLTQNISFELNPEKMRSIELFLRYCKELKL